MPQLKRLLVALAVVLACFAASPRASLAAEPSAADAETALELYKEGKALREKGDLDGGLQKLRAAFALVETPIIAVELAKAYVAKGQLVEAREVLLTVPRIPVRRNESQKADEARAEAATLAAELKPRLATLTVHTQGGGPDAQPVLSIDGAKVPSEAANAPRVVNPGPHAVTVEAYGRRNTMDVTLGEGESKEIAIAVPDKPEGSSAVAPPAPDGAKPGTTPPPPATSSNGARTALVYGGFGTAVIGLGVGAVTGLMTLSKTSTLKDTCTSDGRCPPSSKSDIDGASTTATISTVGFAVGAAGLVAGVIGLVFMKDGVATTGSLDGAGLRGRF
jgi:hypothetical protein